MILKSKSLVVSVYTGTYSKGFDLKLSSPKKETRDGNFMSSALLDIVLIPKDEDYISKYQEYIGTEVISRGPQGFVFGASQGQGRFVFGGQNNNPPLIQSYTCLEKPTPFLLAVVTGRLGLCNVFTRSQLLRERSWPIFASEYGVGPQVMMGVFVACINGNGDLAEMLLVELLEGTNIGRYAAIWTIKEWVDEHGRTPFMLATMHEHCDVLKRLIALIKSPHDSTLLLDSSVLNIQDRFKKNAIMYACESGHLPIVETLVKEKVQLDQHDALGKTALGYAVDKEYWDIVWTLVQAGADPSAYGDVILLHAAEHGDVDVLKRMIELNIDVQTQYVAGRTALMFAVKASQEEAATMLLEAGADPAVHDENDETILTLSADFASVSMVRWCLEHIPADMIDHCTRYERWTALMLAAKRGEVAIVNALIQAGASVLHKRDIQMKTVIDIVSAGDLPNKEAILGILRDVEEQEKLADAMNTQQIHDDEPGDTIAYSDLHFEERCIGSGSFSVVKMATWRGTEVAVKELKNSNLSTDVQDMLRSEVQTLSSLRHPSIVSYYGYCEDPPCIVMELCSDSLSNVLHQCAHGADIGQTMTWKRRIQIATDTAVAMTYLHQAKKYYHRDLRSANILITSRYQAKVSDMGLTRKMYTVSTSSAGTIAKSTPRWLAPELLANGSFTSKSDVYGFGTVLYELATWRQPWADMEDYLIPHAILVQHKRLSIPELESLSGPPPTDSRTCMRFKKIADTCLALEPSDRPDFQDIVSELKILLQYEESPTDQQMSVCCVCTSDPSACVYIGCGHCCVCEPCAQRPPCNHQCPICRQAGQPIKIFFS